MIAAKVKLTTGVWEGWLGLGIHYIQHVLALVCGHRSETEGLPIMETLHPIPLADVEQLETYLAARAAIEKGRLTAHSLGPLMAYDAHYEPERR